MAHTLYLKISLISSNQQKIINQIQTYQPLLFAFGQSESEYRIIAQNQQQIYIYFMDINQRHLQPFILKNTLHQRTLQINTTQLFVQSYPMSQGTPSLSNLKHFNDECNTVEILQQTYQSPLNQYHTNIDKQTTKIQNSPVKNKQNHSHPPWAYTKSIFLVMNCIIFSICSEVYLYSTNFYVLNFFIFLISWFLQPQKCSPLSSNPKGLTVRVSNSAFLLYISFIFYYNPLIEPTNKITFLYPKVLWYIRVLLVCGSMSDN